MKKGFLTKAFVAVGVMASAVVLSAVCAFAGTIYSFGSVNDINSLPGPFQGGTKITVESSPAISSYTYNETVYSFTNCLKLADTSDMSRVLKLTLDGQYDAKFFVSLKSSTDNPVFHVGNNEFNLSTLTGASKTTMGVCEVKGIGTIGKESVIDIYSSTKSTLLYMVELTPRETNLSNGDKFYTNGTESYIIHTLTSDDLNNKKLTLNLADSTKKEINTVYSKVTFGDEGYIEAPTDGALYAIQVTGDVDTSKPLAYTWTVS